MNRAASLLGTDTPPAADRYRIPNLARACKMLELLSSTRVPLSATQIARRLDMPRTTAFRVLRTLLCEGIVIECDKGYVSGQGLMRIGLQALDALEIRHLAPEILRDLAHATGEAGCMGVISGRQVLLLDVHDSPRSTTEAPRAVTFLDTPSSAMGKVQLAFLPQEDLDPYLCALSANPAPAAGPLDTTALRRELKRIRLQGYAVDRHPAGEGPRFLAAPVHGPNRRVVASVGITTSPNGASTERVTEAARCVRHHAARLSERLGFPQEDPGVGS